MYVINTKRQRKELAIISEFTPETIAGNEDFEFDWNLERENLLYKLEIKKSNQILGLISLKINDEELRVEISLLELAKSNVGKDKLYDNVACILIAYACRLAFKLNFFGFVSLIPKTKLIKHYKDKYGFEQFGRHLAIDFERSELLIEKYLEYGHE